MSDCGPPTPPPEELDSPPVLVPPPPGRTTLVTRPNEARPAHTANRECDAVTAAKRGLKEYLEQVSIDVYGKRVLLQTVTDVWAEPESNARSPGVAVMAMDSAEYDASSLTPALDTTPVVSLPTDPPDQRTYLVKYAVVSIPMVIEVFTSSPEERVQVSMLLEDALNPVDWMYGFKLRLPHYFNQIAVYEPVRVQQLDSEENARRRFRPGTLSLTARVPLVRTRSLPMLRPMADVEVTDSSEP